MLQIQSVKGISLTFKKTIPNCLYHSGFEDPHTNRMNGRNATLLLLLGFKITSQLRSIFIPCKVNKWYREKELLKQSPTGLPGWVFKLWTPQLWIDHAHNNVAAWSSKHVLSWNFGGLYPVISLICNMIPSQTLPVQNFFTLKRWYAIVSAWK